MVQNSTREDTELREALWVIDTLALELSRDVGLDRKALVEALRQRAGYEQADSLWPHEHKALQAELVARLAGRLARV